ncbi:MAG: MBL fold metallo-hydrolase, partial [Deltaproteobacteria bacterium]|nr:MBL fold metallo-hydrolase [Deltaproteobacteria bacterium]
MTIQDMLDRMTWLGHASFRIDGSKTVFFDPYNIQPDNKADLVLVTHEHFDHCSP